MARSTFRLAAVLGAALLLACQGGDSNLSTSPCSPLPCTNKPGVAAIQLGVFPGTLVVGDTATLTAAAVDASGDTLDNVTITFSSSTPSVASVSSAGLVTALSIGATSIIARGGGDSASVVLTVVP